MRGIKKVIIFGAGGHGHVLAEIAVDCGFEVSFWDDDKKRTDEKTPQNFGFKIPNKTGIILGIGDNLKREDISHNYPKNVFMKLIHNKAIISNSTKIGRGTAIMAGVCINYNSIIGDHCILNTGAIIDHECTIHDFVHISPNATLCGNVTIGRGTWIGAGATILPGLRIGENVLVGAGSVIIDNIIDGVTVVGNPGKVTIKEKSIR